MTAQARQIRPEPQIGLAQETPHRNRLVGRTCYTAHSLGRSPLNLARRTRMFDLAGGAEMGIKGLHKLRSWGGSKIVFMMLVGFALCLKFASAQAQATFVYSGPAFTNASGYYGPGPSDFVFVPGSVRATVTVENWSPQRTGEPAVLSWSLSSLGYTCSSELPYTYPSIVLSSGQIVGWEFYYPPSYCGGAQIITDSDAGADEAWYCTASQCYGGDVYSVGKWTLVSVQTGTTPPLQITTTSLPNADTGQSYPSTPIIATGGSGAGYKWSLASGSLPPGFTLSPEESCGNACTEVALSSTGNPPAPVGTGSYNFTVQVTDSAGGLATQPLTLVVQCPVFVNLSFTAGPQYMIGQFTAPNSSDSSATRLLDYAADCNFVFFNWQQMWTTLPPVSNLEPVNPGPLVASGNVVYTPLGIPGPPSVCLLAWLSDCYLTAPPAFYDPPSGGYIPKGNKPLFNPYPFSYYQIETTTPGGYCTLPGHCPAYPDVLSLDGTTLTFLDDPAIHELQSGQFVAFQTSLVGVDNQGNPHTLYYWNWHSTFNGTAGGTETDQSSSVNPIDPGSGTGGVTVTNINGVQLPAVVPSSQVSTTASGLAYSRVSQTFNGTVTLRNISGSAISGPLQIVFFGIPANVTLLNATANLSGTPYLTVPSVASLAPGQSTTVNVQFKNPSNGMLNLTPVIYSGSIN